MKHFAITFCLLFMFCFSLRAQDTLHEKIERLSEGVTSMQQMIQQMQETICEQESRIQALEKENSTLKEELNQTTKTSLDLPMSSQATGGEPRGTAATGLNAFNPEIGLVADIVGSFSESSEDEHGNDKISVRHLELILGHDLDPYGRFDATIAFSEFHDTEIEEAYLTFWALPADIKMRLGRLRPKIGKATAVHRGQLETIDEPLFVQEYLGHGGLFRTGLELSSYIPLPSEILTMDKPRGYSGV